ncbi:hypothetical protein PENSUB_11086 [Penicillium subrubescens]|uniref:Uncharacterized protein n=1 Tax=Penicillium subrubescens TaxID=1316194 RepID=A0A1Q5T5S2_9EURO|nr:hypothetical protein PENSUB_11086 [Penicillium subrubescens]
MPSWSYTDPGPFSPTNGWQPTYFLPTSTAEIHPAESYCVHTAASCMTEPSIPDLSSFRRTSGTSSTMSLKMRERGL